jgi:nucleotidyltransferase/DNA polymerase involved in DNA repair
VAGEIKAILRECADRVREVSVDEAYLDVTERTAWTVVDGRPLAKGYARHVKQRIAREVGVPASVGVAPTMSAAKVASDHDKPDGLVVVEPGEVREFFDPLPVEAVHGVGPVTARELGEMGIETVCDGTNASDVGTGHRPGLRAVEELEVLSPLLEHSVSKDEVRALAENFGLSVADKPSMACLSSRIPTGLRVTPSRLSRVEAAEQVLRDRGFSQFRVRDHDGLARVELGTDELPEALTVDFASEVGSKLEELGFEHVTLDLNGYQMGSVSPNESTEKAGLTY